MGWEDARESLCPEAHSVRGGRPAELLYASGKALDRVKGYGEGSVGCSAYSASWGLGARSEGEDSDELGKSCGEWLTVKYCGSGGWSNDSGEAS